MPATVRQLANGCWRWHVDYNVAHWEEYDFCSSGGQLLLEANRNSQSWDFGTLKIDNLARFTCPTATTVLPRGPVAGQMLGWSCTGTNTAVAGQSTSTTAARIIATDTLRIGRTVVPVHQRQQTTLSGAQGGTASEDWWLETKSGLPLRMEGISPS